MHWRWPTLLVRSSVSGAVNNKQAPVLVIGGGICRPGTSLPHPARQ
jgi:hypothetical protein